MLKSALMDFKIIAVLGIAAGLSTGWPATEGAVTENDLPRPSGAVTFSGQIAKIIHQRCAGCHHEGQSAPFNLVSYEDARKHAKQILEVTEGRIMPPWLAEPGYGTFSNERRLTTEEMDLIRQWVAGG